MSRAITTLEPFHRRHAHRTALEKDALGPPVRPMLGTQPGLRGERESGRMQEDVCVVQEPEARQGFWSSVREAVAAENQ